jgi:hypothetical protein
MLRQGFAGHRLLHAGTGGGNEEFRIGWSGVVLLDGIYDSVCSFICEVAVHDEDGVDDAGYPKEQCQDDVQQELNGLASEQYGKGRQDNCEQISHCTNPQ